MTVFCGAPGDPPRRRGGLPQTGGSTLFAWTYRDVSRGMSEGLDARGIETFLICDVEVWPAPGKRQWMRQQTRTKQDLPWLCHPTRTPPVG